MEIQRHTLRSGGVDLTYGQRGKGRDVLYLHGALTTFEEGFIGLGPTLAKCVRLTAIDRPGHGGSGTLPGGGSIWTQADVITEACSELGLVRPIVIGHSFGGAVAMAMALHSPKAISGVIALAPIAFPELRAELTLFGPRALPGVGPAWTALARSTDPALLPGLWNGMFLPQAMTETFRAGFPFEKAGMPDRLQAEGADALLLAAGLAKAARLYDRCVVPVHILQGDRDMVVNPVLHGRRLAETLPDARFTWLEGLGHMAHHFAPEAVLAAVENLMVHGSGTMQRGQ